MAIQSEITDKQTDELQYPCLMEYCDKDGYNLVKRFVVLFTSPTTGVVVASEESTREVGTMSAIWTEATEKKVWKKFSGVIELKNV